MKINELDVQSIGRDPDALEALYRSEVATVQRFIARRTTDPHHAADLTADVFISAIDTCRSYDSKRGTPRSWLLGVARNVILADARRRAREQRTNSRIIGRALLDPDDMARAVEIIDSQREARELAGSFEGLSVEERQVLELVAIDELSLNEAAEVLGVKPGTARVRLHRARRRLAKGRAVIVPTLGVS